MMAAYSDGGSKVHYATGPQFSREIHLYVGVTSSHEGSPGLDTGAKGANAWGPQLSNAKAPQPASSAASAWSANKGICSFLNCCCLWSCFGAEMESIGEPRVNIGVSTIISLQSCCMPWHQH